MTIASAAAPQEHRLYERLHLVEMVRVAATAQAFGSCASAFMPSMALRMTIVEHDEPLHLGMGVTTKIDADLDLVCDLLSCLSRKARQQERWQDDACDSCCNARRRLDMARTRAMVRTNARGPGQSTRLEPCRSPRAMKVESITIVLVSTARIVWFDGSPFPGSPVRQPRAETLLRRPTFSELLRLTEICANPRKSQWHSPASWTATATSETSQIRKGRAASAISTDALARGGGGHGGAAVTWGGSAGGHMGGGFRGGHFGAGGGRFAG